MPTYLSPGVYIEEIPSGSKPIEGVSTSTAAFVGAANRGPLDAPILIGKLDDYVATFGNITSESDSMGLAVLAFYLNGGKAAYVCRMGARDAANLATYATASAALAGNAGATPAVLTVSATSPGVWANTYFVVISNADATTRTFDLAVGVQATVNGAPQFRAVETFAGLSMANTSDDFAELRINGTSGLITVDVNPPGNQTVDNTAAIGVGLGSTTAGDDGDPLVATDYTRFYNEILRKFRDASVILLPGQYWQETPVGSGNYSNSVVAATQAFCEAHQRSVLLIDLPQTLEIPGPSPTIADLTLPTSTYTALYYPWVQVANPLFNETTNPLAARTVGVPPSAFAAGIYAKIDGKRGVWKAPAGVETNLAGVAALQFNVEDLEQSQLNPAGINCIRKLPNFGPVIWGARTLATRADPEWRYVPVRRTAIFIEQSIYQGIQWAVFEPNDFPLWGSLRANIGSFMNGLFRSGAFQGATAKDAYFVRCGLGDTMTQGDIDRGQVIVIVGFAPLKPAEFVIVRIQQKVGQQ